MPVNAILISPLSVRIHLLRLIGAEELLNNSIHSSFAEARVPAQAISLIRIDCGGYGVEGAGAVSVDVGFGVDVGVSVGLAEGEMVALAEGETVTLAEGEMVALAEGETVALMVAETVAVRVAGVAVSWRAASSEDG